jgi:hypothetical protein
MKTLLITALFAVAIVRAPASAVEVPRHLIYSFTFGVQGSDSSRDSATVESNGENGLVGTSGSGISHYQGSVGDTGTMNVDITGQESDGGVVVSISENGKDTRKAPAATCVVYANTSVLCDPNKTVNEEEYTLLRFLSPNFVDPTRMDAQQRWHVSQSSQRSTVSADYGIEHSANGMLSIKETRSIRGQGPGVATVDGQTSILYDFNSRVPASIDEYVTQRTERGVAGNSTSVFQTTLKLVSDSSSASH